MTAAGELGVTENIVLDRDGAVQDSLGKLRERGIGIALDDFGTGYASLSLLKRNVIEQDHRAIKRAIEPMMGFKNFRCARVILSGIKVMHMIRKGQMQHDGDTRTAAEQFYSLVM